MAANNIQERRDSNEFTSLPLDELTIDITTKEGEKKTVPALHIGFGELKYFVSYIPPPLWANLGCEKGPQKASKFAPDFSQADTEEWLEATWYLIQDLNWLLKLPHHRFWSQVVYDDEIHICLHSYLITAQQYHSLNKLNSESSPSWPAVQETMGKIHNLVFLVYLRMSTFKESKSCHISPHVFGELIYDRYIFDIPGIMDLCVLYGKENRVLLHKMIDNIFTIQPQYYEDLNQNIISYLKLLESIAEKLGLKTKSKMDSWFDLKSPNQKEEIPKWTENDFDNIRDSVMCIVEVTCTASAFVDIYPTVCDTFHENNFEISIAVFYETVFKVVEDYLEKIEKNHPKNSKIAKQLLERIKLSKAEIIKLFRNIVFSTCLQPVLDSGGKGDMYIEQFLQIICACLGEKSFICDYESNFPFEDDLDMISQTNCVVDETRTSFIRKSILSIMGVMDSNDQKPLHFAPKTKETKRLDKLLHGETIDDHPLLGAIASLGIHGIELESLISAVLDVFPDLGHGFIRSCLEYYNFESETVINALLEQSLPSCLGSLDRNQATYQPSVRPKISSEKPSLHKNKSPFSDLLSERKNVFDGDEFDIFSKNEIDRSKIHKGKKTGHKDISSLLDDKKDVLAVKESYRKYENTFTEGTPAEGNDQFLYDDEYDDTYDDTTTAAWGNNSDRTPGDDIALGRKFTIPRILRTKDQDEDDEEEEDDEDDIPVNTNREVLNDERFKKQPQTNGHADSRSTTQSSNSRYKQRSDRSTSQAFGSSSRSDYERNSSEYPSSSRQEVNPQSESANSFRSREFRPKKEFTNVKGKAKGQGQDDKTLHARKSKEQHKGAYGNHNRKAQSDRKRNSGMIHT